jgi:hypothetical protein
MALFDVVRISCPKCECLVDFQTKAGKNMLLVYEEDHVPSGLAVDINGKIEECPNCKIKLMACSSVPVYSRVWAVEDGGEK